MLCVKPFVLSLCLHWWGKNDKNILLCLSLIALSDYDFSLAVWNTFNGCMSQTLQYVSRIRYPPPLCRSLHLLSSLVSKMWNGLLVNWMKTLK